MFNFHTHTRYCDGTSDPEDYVKKALMYGFSALGFSGHAPMPIKNDFAIAEDDLHNYADTIRALKKKYLGKIEIYLSLEMDFIPDITKDFSFYKKLSGLDYTIGSVHLVRSAETDGLWFIDGAEVKNYDQGLQQIFSGNIRKAVTQYYHQINQMIETQKPDIVGHLDKIKMHNKNRYFREEEYWYTGLLEETLALIKKSGSIVEVNTRGIYKKRADDLFPGIAVLKRIKDLHIPITLSSDAHKPEELNGFLKEGVQILQKLGFKALHTFRNSTWTEVPVVREGAAINQSDKKI